MNSALMNVVRVLGDMIEPAVAAPILRNSRSEAHTNYCSSAICYIVHVNSIFGGTHEQSASPGSRIKPDLTREGEGSWKNYVLKETTQALLDQERYRFFLHLHGSLL